MICNSVALTLITCRICFGSLICGVITSSCGYYKLSKYKKERQAARSEIIVLFVWAVIFYIIAFSINLYVAQ